MTESRRPRALVLAHTVPFPLVSGERIRNQHLLRALRRGEWDITLFALDRGGSSTPADRQELAELCDAVHVVPIDPSRWTQLRSVLLGRPVYEKFFYDEGAQRELDVLLEEEYDVIVVEALYMSVYLPDARRRQMLLDAHNAELLRVESMAAALGLTPRGVAARLQRRPLQRYERHVASTAAHVTCVSAEDAAYFERLAPGRVSVVPNGVDCEAIVARTGCPPDPSILFVGSMDYSANVDAVGYLAGEILPALDRHDVRVTVIGSNPRREAFEHARRSAVPIDILGFVADTTPHFARSRVFVVPLRFGGGTRLKILEALARGIPVVTTTLGCEGLDLRHEHDVVIADDPQEFAGWLERLLEDDELCTRLSRNGRRTVESRYDWKEIGERFDAVARSLAKNEQYDRAVPGGSVMTLEGRRSSCR
jgi:glycosyltransferase involved in cell wall biosynthesis